MTLNEMFGKMSLLLIRLPPWDVFWAWLTFDWWC